MEPSSKLSWLYHELGLHSLVHSGRDVYLLLLGRFFRMFAYGSGALVLAIYFNKLGLGDDKIGLFMTATLLGDVVISLVLTLFADALGRRRILMLGSLLMAMSGVVFALSGNFMLLLIAAIIGVISPSGNEIGPFKAIEESTIAHLTSPETRSDIFAWHIVFGTAAVAVGTTATGWLVDGLQGRGYSEVESYRAIFWMYAAMGCIKFVLAALLSPACEMEEIPSPQPTPELESSPNDEEEDAGDDAPFLQNNNPSGLKRKPEPKPTPKKSLGFAQLSPKSRVIIIQLCLLFAVDSYGSGLATFSFISYYMEQKFKVDPKVLGSTLSITWIFAALSNMVASSISKRIGLIRTMVFTHFPASFILALIPLPSTYGLTLILLAIRSSLASMDQSPRSAFLSSVVLPEERTATMGIVNVCKTLSQSAGPLTTGLLAHSGLFWVAFVLAGTLKCTYDLGLITFFLRVELEGEKKRTRTDEDTELQPADANTSH